MLEIFSLWLKDLSLARQEVWNSLTLCWPEKEKKRSERKNDRGNLEPSPAQKHPFILDEMEKRLHSLYIHTYIYIHLVDEQKFHRASPNKFIQTHEYTYLMDRTKSKLQTMCIHTQRKKNPYILDKAEESHTITYFGFLVLILSQDNRSHDFLSIFTFYKFIVSLRQKFMS